MASLNTHLVNSLGLRPNEAKAYLCCLKRPEGLFVYQLARASGIKRSTLDVILQRLMERGYITSHMEGARRVFCAEPPEKILFQVEKSAGLLRTLLPRLKEMGGEAFGRVRYFRGRSGIEEIFDDILATAKADRDKVGEILTFSSGDHLFRALPTHYRDFIRHRVRNKIALRWLGPDNKASQKLLRNAETEYRQMKLYPAQKYNLTIEIDIYADRVAFISLEEDELLGVIIESVAISSSMCSIFNLLWDILP